MPSGLNFFAPYCGLYRGKRVAHDPSLIMLKGLQVLNGRSCKPSLLQMTSPQMAPTRLRNTRYSAAGLVHACVMMMLMMLSIIISIIITQGAHRGDQGGTAQGATRGHTGAQHRGQPGGTGVREPGRGRIIALAEEESRTPYRIRCWGN